VLEMKISSVEISWTTKLKGSQVEIPTSTTRNSESINPFNDFTGSLTDSLPRTSLDSPWQCQICHRIEQAVKLWPHENNRWAQVVICAEKELATSICPGHAPLKASYPDKAGPSHLIIHQNSEKALEFGHQFENENSWRMLGEYVPVFGQWNRSAAISRSLVPEQIGPKRLLEWKTLCNSHHGNRCRSGLEVARKYFTSRPRLLVDVQRMCLVVAQQSYTYVTLSYVWGNANVLKTEKANFEELKLPSALSRPPFAHLLPMTIQNAIRVTDWLGERYLWIDSLCIVQDDEANKQSEFDSMASIYANATLTIVAADSSNANDGLCGLTGNSSQRKEAQTVLRLSDRTSLVKRTIAGQDGELGKSIWSRRGWTFQEDIFSRRKVIFCNSHLEWTCQCGHWTEGFTGEELLPMVQSTELSRISSPWPDIAYLAKLVRLYGARSLTYEKDALAAFSGIIDVLSYQFQGGFLYGMPELFFDIALLWSPEDTGADERAQETQGSKSLLFQYHPSWSWTAWRGRANLDVWEMSSEYLKRRESQVRIPRRVQVTPTVYWSILEKGTGTMRLIQSDWNKYKDLAFKTKDSRKEALPQGWTRHPGTFQRRRDYPPPGPNQSHYFTYNGDMKTHFWYPIPMYDHPPSTSTDSGPPRIHCRTLRTFLTGNKRPIGNTAHLSLLDGNLRCIGAMLYHKVTPPRWRIDKPETSLLEVIEISKGWSTKLFVSMCSSMEELNYFAQEQSEWLIGDGECEFYNVLWIEWEEGIAYRRGIGRVLASFWESAKKEWADVNLG
jgi:hypothetical protein